MLEIWFSQCRTLLKWDPKWINPTADRFYQQWQTAEISSLTGWSNWKSSQCKNIDSYSWTAFQNLTHTLQSSRHNVPKDFGCVVCSKYQIVLLFFFFRKQIVFLFCCNLWQLLNYLQCIPAGSTLLQWRSRVHTQ